MSYQQPEDMYEYMMEQHNEAVYFEEDYDPAYDYDEGEPPALPEGDGTWRLGNGWEDHGKTDGYFVAMTQGDYDWEVDAEYGELVGKWWDHETGVTHIDRVDWYPERESAEAAGREYDQIAIWDIAAGKEIRL